MSKRSRFPSSQLALKFMLPCTAIVMLAGGVVAFYISSAAHQAIDRGAADQAKNAILTSEDVMLAADRTVMERLETGMSQFQQASAALGTPSIRGTVRIRKMEVPALYLGSHLQTGNNQLVEQIHRTQGYAASIFVRSGTRFIRVATTVRNSRGRLIVGSELDSTQAVYARLIQGRSYYGEAQIMGHPFLTIYEPMFDREGTLIGAWYVGYSMRSMAELRQHIAQTRILDSGFVAITDRDRHLLFHSSNATPLQVFQRLSNQGNPDWIVQEHLYAPWGYRIIAAYPRAGLEAAAHQLLRRIFLFYVGGSLLLAALIYVLVHTLITRRIGQLVEAATRISEGELDVALPRSSPDEIGVLVGTLDSMVASLRQAIDRANQNAEVAVAAAREAECQRDRAEEMNRVKTAFLGNMSHELRTPLTAIIGFSDLILEEPDHGQHTYAAMIRKGGERLLTTLQALLDLAQIEANLLRLQPLPTDLSALIQDTCEGLRPRAEERGLELSWSATPSRLIGLVDREAARRVLTHLVDNAIKFTPRGSINVRASAVNGHAVVTVRDTGIGIAASFLPHLFNEFKQESEGIDRAYEGNGLGLTISKKLVELMGGTINVTSQKGQGTEVSIQVPRATASSIPHMDATLSTSQTRRLLVVEDDPAARSLITVLLRGRFEVDVASDAENALLMARGRLYDAVLLDINLGPGMTGDELLPKLRNLPGYQTVPCFALTAYALPGDEQRFLASGFDAYLSKPFTREGLLRLLET